MSGASIWAPGGAIPVSANADNTILTQRFTATARQSLFTLTGFAYQVATNSLAVYINGVFQHLSDDFSETSNTSFTVTGGCNSGDIVVAVGLVGSTGAQAATTSAAQAAVSAAAAAASYAAIVALSLPNLPLTISNGGTNAATKTAAFDNLSPLNTKGDLLGFDGSHNTRLGIGTNGKALVADSTTSTGFKWAFTNIATVASTVTTNTAASSTPSIYPCNTTALGSCITAPDATSLPVGLFAVIDNEAGGYPVGWRDSTGTLAGKNVVNAGGFGFVWLEDNSTAAGVWRISGNSLAPGMITADTTLSSTYGSTVLPPYTTFDSSKSLHFIPIAANGFAAMVYDAVTGAFGAPVTVTTTASSAPKHCFNITSTTAIVFYGDTTSVLRGVVITLSGATTLTVGTPASSSSNSHIADENFKNEPKIAQLDTNLFLVSYATANGAGTTSVMGIQVSGGTTVNFGAAADIISANNCASSTQTYKLTTTTAAVLYKSGAFAPYTNSAVVISVTNANPPVCTVGTPAAATSCQGSVTAACPSALLSATKIVIADDNNTSQVTASGFTFSGTTTTAWTALNVETSLAGTGSALFTGNSATRYNSHLSLVSAGSTNTALFWYLDSNISRVVILSETSGTVTKGTINYQTITIAAAGSTASGVICPQGTSEFLTVKDTQASTAGYWMSVMTNKISGTTITWGETRPLRNIAQDTSVVCARLSSGDYIITGDVPNGGNSISVFRTNGDVLNHRGDIACPGLQNTVMINNPGIVANNRIILSGNTTNIGNTIGASSSQSRFIHLELAQ